MIECWNEHHGEGGIENAYIMSNWVDDDVGKREETALISMRGDMHIEFEMSVRHGDIE